MMRADKDFRTYEQALTIVQRLGDLAETDRKKGNHAEAQYHMSHAIFVGVKHLLFMTADASVDRTEARDLAAKNHLAVVEILAVILSGMRPDGEGNDDSTPVAAKRKVLTRSSPASKRKNTAARARA